MKSDHNLSRRPTVTIVGAGITGLTAAHELVIRGFEVTVVEPEVSRYSQGTTHVEIGGMARTQYAVGELSDQQWRSGPWDPPERPLPSKDVELGEDADGAGLFPVDVEFGPDEGALGVNARKVLDEVANWFSQQRSRRYTLSLSLHVPVLMPTEEPVTSSQGGRLWNKRHASIRQYLMTHEHHPIPEDRILEGVPMLAGGIRIRVHCVMLPGEHGFRFFPSYYRHVFDTMSRIPIIDSAGSLTAQTVLDNVRTAPYQAFAETGANPIIFPTSPIKNASDWFQQVSKLFSIGYTPGDVSYFLNRVLRFIATCPARRAAEYENISWGQYLQGYSPVTRTNLYTYSPEFTRDLDFSPRILAAFDAQIGDARSCGDTYVQLLTSSLINQPRTDGTLTAPTTEAWFNPWRKFLKYRGVNFVNGRLEELVLKDGKLVATWEEKVLADSANQEFPIEKFHTEESDYIIVATDVVSAERVSRRLPPVGVPARLQGYTTLIPSYPGSSHSSGPPRDPLRSQLGLVCWDRLQTITGIQFFYRVEFKLVEGYLYMNKAPWALSSVNSQQFWRFSPNNEQNGYTSVTSIDIGDWNAQDKHGQTMWGATRDQIALSTLEQRSDSLKRYREGLPQPFWYHIDKNLEFDETSGRLIGNNTPFLIPIMGDWKNRPGANPWDPTIGATPAPSPTPIFPLAHGLWQASHGGYEVHWNRLVYAGTYLRTFTRMTSMESANESARHAVNAILDHCVRRRTPVHSPPAPGPIEYDPEFVRSTAFGDYCRIWNLEQNELPDMNPFKELDNKLFALGLPNVWDVIGLEAHNDSLSLPWQFLNGWLWRQAPAAASAHPAYPGVNPFPPSAPGTWMGGLPWMGMPMPGVPMPGMPMPGVPMPGMPMPGVPMPGMPQATWPGMPIPGMPGMPMGIGGSGPPPSVGPEAFYQWLRQMRERLENALQQASIGMDPPPPRTP